ncbi:MAG: hypothetical protein PHV33_09300 [Elusimicrobiales bacterium]|nr:hypothetical protein [Elusimicrobiales bacterium]
MKSFLLRLCLLLTLAAPAGAAEVVEREMKCPLCGRDFYAQLDVPDADYEMRLDLKPLGALPGPWRLPECPGCGLVIYSSRLPKDELARALRIAASPDYLKHATRSTYYKTGVLYGLLGKPDYLLANTFLKASWQEEASPALLKEDLELALKHFTACAAACKGAEQENSRLLIGELLRRLGRFAEASAQLSALKADKGFQNNFFADIVDFQLKLCAKQDARVYEMIDVKVAKLPFFARTRWRAKKLSLQLWDSLKKAARR